MTGGGLGSFLSASVFWLTGACCGGIVVKKFAVPAVACVIRAEIIYLSITLNTFITI